MFQELAVFLSMAREINLISSQLISLRSGLILSSYLYVDFPSEFFPWELSNQKLARISVSPVCHMLCLAWISSPIWNVWGSTYSGTSHAFPHPQICCYFFLRRSRYFLTSKMIHICRNNSVCSWWFSLPFTHKIVLLFWFCTKDVSPDKLSH